MNVKEAIEKLKLYPEDAEVTSLAVDLLKKPSPKWVRDYQALLDSDAGPSGETKPDPLYVTTEQGGDLIPFEKAL